MARFDVIQRCLIAIIFLIVLYAPIQSPAQDKIMTATQTPTQTEPSQNPTIQALATDRDHLQASLDRWNAAYIAALALTVLVATAAGLSQLKTILRAKALVAVQSKIESESDRQLKIELTGRDLEIAKLNKVAGELNKTASDAQERAAKAESHLADANARISEATARFKEAEAQVASASAASKDAVAKVAIAEARSAEASTKAEAFRLDIAKANEAAAQANRIAEQERLARVRLEDVLAGWRIAPEAAARLTNKLKPFTGTNFDFFANPAETPFLNAMDKILLDAGWNRQTPKGSINLSNMASILFVSGLSIEISADSVAKFGPAVNALVEGLGTEGISVKASAHTDGVDPAAMHIIIGRKE
jgi:hypothetical protein